MPELVSDELIEHVAERFRVLGDVTRLSILRLLRERGEMNVGEICAELETSQANASKHLRTLATAGIVARRREGTAAYYAITDPTVSKLCDVVCARIVRQAKDGVRALAIV